MIATLAVALIVLAILTFDHARIVRSLRRDLAARSVSLAELWARLAGDGLIAVDVHEAERRLHAEEGERIARLEAVAADHGRWIADGRETGNLRQALNAETLLKHHDALARLTARVEALPSAGAIERLWARLADRDGAVTRLTGRLDVAEARRVESDRKVGALSAGLHGLADAVDGGDAR